MNHSGFKANYFVLDLNDEVLNLNSMISYFEILTEICVFLVNYIDFLLLSQSLFPDFKEIFNILL